MGVFGRMTRKMLIIFALFFIVSCSGLNLREDFEGSGILQCFGNITLELAEGETEGVARCRPEFENEENGISYAPQGFIADGADGSHWVVVDDRGSADCEGQITFNIGDHNLGYCSYPPTEERGTSCYLRGHSVVALPVKGIYSCPATWGLDVM